jgi:hypothetical protein
MSSIGGFDSNLHPTFLQSNSCPNSTYKKAGMQAIAPGQKCTGYVETRSAMR